MSFIRTVSSIRWWTSVLCSHSRPVKVCLQHMNWTGKCELKYGHTCSSIFSTNNRSFLPRLWSKLLASVRQPRINLSNSDSPLSVALPPSVSSTHHPHHPLFPHFHSRLKTYLFRKSFPSYASFSSSARTPWISQTVYWHFWTYSFLPCDAKHPRY